MAVLFHASFVFAVHILLFLSCLVRGSLSRFKPCQQGFFYKALEDQCLKCSECPPRQIILTPCSKVTDVQCEVRSIKILQSSQDERSDTESDNFNQNQATVEKEDREYWKKLALALIGALSILIVVATIIVIVAWAKVHKATIVKLPEEADTDDADSGYVVIRSIRHMALPRSNTPAVCCPRDGDDASPPLLQSESTNESSRSTSSCLHAHQQPVCGSLCYLPKVYKPQRRILNYDADDVFESDDNCGSKAKLPPGQPRARNERRCRPY